MKSKKVVFLVLFIIGMIGNISAQTQQQDYQPNFPSLEKVNPVPEWFKDAKFGIYFHYGLNLDKMVFKEIVEK